MIAELTRRAAQNLELTLKSEIKVGPRLSEEGRLKRRSRKCNTTRGEPKACAKEEANQSEWRQGKSLIDPASGTWDEQLITSIFNALDARMILLIPMNCDTFEHFLAWHYSNE